MYCMVCKVSLWSNFGPVISIVWPTAAVNLGSECTAVVWPGSLEAASNANVVWKWWIPTHCLLCFRELIPLRGSHPHALHHLPNHLCKMQNKWHLIGCYLFFSLWWCHADIIIIIIWLLLFLCLLLYCWLMKLLHKCCKKSWGTLRQWFHCGDGTERPLVECWKCTHFSR